MARMRGNPYSGQYSPAKVPLGKEDLVKGLRGIKVKSPNKHMTTSEYKSGLKKEQSQNKAG